MTHQQIVVAAFIVKNNRVLLAKRPPTKLVAPSKYHLPGGHVEFGENPTDALRREIQEELKIDIIVGFPFFTFSYKMSDIHTVGIAYHATVIDPVQKIITDPRDTERIVWIGVTELGLYLDKNDHNYIAISKGYESLN